MSTEDIINAWKNRLQPAKKQANPFALSKKGSVIPANPAGEQELSDEDLALVEGGVLGETSHVSECTCEKNSCN